MISNQILQTTLDGLKAITRIDLGICDTCLLYTSDAADE